MQDLTDEMDIDEYQPYVNRLKEQLVRLARDYDHDISEIISWAEALNNTGLFEPDEITKYIEERLLLQ